MRRAMLLLAAVAIALLLASGATLADTNSKTDTNSNTNAPIDPKSQDTIIQSQGTSESDSEDVSAQRKKRTPPPPTSTKNGFTLTTEVSPTTVEVGDQMTITVTETNNTGLDFLFGGGINDILPRKAVSVVSVEGPPDLVEGPPNPVCSTKNKRKRTLVNCRDFVILDGQTVTMTITVEAKRAGTFRNNANDTSFPGNKVSAPFTITPAV